MDTFESIADRLRKIKIAQNHSRYSIYFIECNGLYKIGWTANIKSRFDTLQTSNPLPIRLVHEIPIPVSDDHGQVEKALHTIFKEAHVRGEWYNISELDIERIKAISIDIILQIAKKMSEIERRKVEDQLVFDFYDDH